MRMVKIHNKSETLEEVAKKFLLVKEAQHCSENTLYDYQTQVSKFVEAGSNSIEYEKLEKDVLQYFGAIPDTSPAARRPHAPCGTLPPVSSAL